MTRINVGIPVANLTDEHLLAEHREIKRLPKQHNKPSLNNKSKFIPDSFCLGKGHVNFFYNKSLYTQKRYLELYNECLYRNFSVTDYRFNWSLYITLGGDYSPSESDTQLIIDRITDRINSSKKDHFHYYGKIISKQDAISLLHSK